MLPKPYGKVPDAELRVRFVRMQNGQPPFQRKKRGRPRPPPSGPFRADAGLVRLYVAPLKPVEGCLSA